MMHIYAVVSKDDIYSFSDGYRACAYTMNFGAEATSPHPPSHASKTRS